MISTIRILIGSLWVLIAGDIVANYWLQPKLPIAVLEAMRQLPLHSFAQIALIISLLVLALASINLWFGKNSGRWLFVASIGGYQIYSLLLGSHAVYQGISFFDDSILVLSGIMLGVIFSAPYNALYQGVKQLPPRSLALFRNLIILSMMVILFLVLSGLSGQYTDHSMPKVMLDFYHAIPTNNLVDKISTVIFIINFLALIALCLRLKFSRSIYVLSVIGLVLCDSPSSDVTTAQDAIFGGFYLISLGIILAIIYCQPLSQQFIEVGSRINRYLR